MGHLTRLANALVQNTEKGPNAEQLGRLLKGEGQGCGGGGQGCGPGASRPVSSPPSRAARGAAGALGGLRVWSPGRDQQEERRGPGEAAPPCAAGLSSARAPRSRALPVPALTPARPPPQVSTHHLHSSSDDEDDRLKEFNFPEEAVLQQVGGAAGAGGCPARAARPPPAPDRAPPQAFMDFQMQRMTSAFIDHFGFNDEEFGEQEESVK